MASLLLFLRAIVSANDEGLTGAAAEEEKETTTHEQRPGKWTFPSTRPATARFDGGTGTEEEERWLVSCLEWPRVNRKSAWMQIV
ncbi:unnamed protein product [Miscanthus lutarioriparius]|uniref:Uncharacterized protein n=1 Tax=Miscanthus lutarioriparius TaxID=422564 RepID=A0A811NZ26_9POAL|nr:unnamed protein product [Miscanthus lutarioriparius]